MPDSAPDPGAAAQRRRTDETYEVWAGAVWRHAATGHDYVVVCLSVDETTLDLLVTYRCPVTGWHWTRPLPAWRGVVTLMDGRTTPRFVRCEEGGAP